ncbi:hypothetical protein Salat_2096200 [Sesamum alatum]|uniref:Zinc knuckle CX2CX4HX4C domain-containing protein n=1 Tax=Sesamum alatum TaxID=300844 RepID=A0AAE1Y1D1_9LAMI|nr:hypothetical protein Salat_2096200 [Sesamum alatum]
MEEAIAGLRGRLRLTEDEGQRLVLPGSLWHADLDSPPVVLGWVPPLQQGYPWSFEKNIILLSGIGEKENPLQVDLDWCDFYVHVHELPFIMMNLGVATQIDNWIGRFRDMDMDDTGCSWGAALRLRVAINITHPLPCALPIVSTLGDELLVYLTYKRLPNFCYLCGQLSHIAKYCELQFEDGFVDPSLDSPYRPWL